MKPGFFQQDTQFTAVVHGGDTERALASLEDVPQNSGLNKNAISGGCSNESEQNGVNGGSGQMVKAWKIMWLEKQAGVVGQGSRACSMGGKAVGGAWVPDSQAGMVWFLGHAEQGLPLTDL